MLLLAAWVVHFLYPVYYTVSILKIHDKQSEILEHPGNSLEKISLSQETFSKCYNERNKELNINGTFYDVAGYDKSNDIITCYVVTDKEETSLNKRISSEWQQQQNTRTTKQVCCWWPVVMLRTSILRPLVYSDILVKKYPLLNIMSVHKGFTLGNLQPPQCI